jgi:hypothetical protein
VLHAQWSAESTPPPSGSEEKQRGQGDFIMAARDPRCRSGAHLLRLLALGIPCLVVGCGVGGDSSKPAPVETSLAKKAQEHLGGYKQQMIEYNKAQAKAKAEGKKSP